MVVNSLNFLFFFAIVFIVYYLPVFRNNSRFQNSWLFLTSYFFYGFVDYKMVLLLLGATIIFYGLGILLRREMEASHVKTASALTTFGVGLGVAFLLYFKYLNFFADSLANLLNLFGFHVSWTTLNIIMPLGVSFFTFKLISYIVEIHRERIMPSRDFIQFATYIAFFPTILSGPIDRPNKFIPQLNVVRTFNYGMAVDGCRQILWGMFTKMCIADNLAVVTDDAWNNMQTQSSSYLLTSALLYPIQMYADFDGYSNMAIGVGKLLGIRITQNFNHPFLARNTAEYWRRWHMSLTSWITDYIFMPLNIIFRNIGKWGTIIAAIINLVVIGLWHGANWTYGLFGLYHGLLFIPLVLSGSFAKNKKLKANGKNMPYRSDLVKMAFTFLLVAFGLVIFRAESISSLYGYLHGIFFNDYFPFNKISSVSSIPYFLFLILLSVSLFALEWYCRNREYVLQSLNFVKNRYAKVIIYAMFFIFINLFANVAPKQFIYFQF